jgi:glycosyltransferase involved in cell wall biosynthesis
MVKIYLINSYFTKKGEKNVTGSDKFAINLISKDVEKGIKVILIAPKSILPILGRIEVNFIDSGSYEKYPLLISYLFRTFRALKELIRIQGSGDIVSASDFFTDVIPAFLFSRKYRWIAFTYHLYPFSLSLRSLVGRTLQIVSFFAFTKASKVFVTNKESENFLKKNFRIKKVHKINLGIDLKEYLNATGFQKENRNLLYLGRFKESKGFFELPEIVYYLNQNNPDFILNVVGNGSDDDIDKLKEMLVSYKVKDKVKIHRNLSDSKVIELLKISNILIHPSFEEGFSLAILESLASNLKICAYDLPVYKEIYEDFEILTCKIHNTKSFAKNIEKLLKSKQKTNYSKEMFDSFDFAKIYDFIFT